MGIHFVSCHVDRERKTRNLLRKRQKQLSFHGVPTFIAPIHVLEAFEEKSSTTMSMLVFENHIQFCNQIRYAIVVAIGRWPNIKIKKV
jgi:hypothetical protein